MKIQVNPNTEAGGFGYVEAGLYRLRIVKEPEVRQKQGSAHNYLNWTFEFADPNVKATNEKLKPGSIFEITTLKDDAQFRLKQLTNALGLDWDNLPDTLEMVGLEFDAQVGIEEYEGNMRNCVKKYIAVK